MGAIRFVVCFISIMYISWGNAFPPKRADLNDMVEKSKAILIVEFLDADSTNSEYHLKVFDAIKGTATDEIYVGQTLYGKAYLSKNEKFIAFINHFDQLEWAGYSENVYHDIVHLTGFYDFNGYGVSPAGITLKQLKTYIKYGTYNGTIHAVFDKGSKETFEWDKEPIEFDIEYKYNGEMVASIKNTNFIVSGFTNPVKVRYWGSGLYITYGESSYRPLQFLGWVDSIDASGNHFNSKLVVDKPTEINAEEFSQYVNTPSMGYIYYEIDVNMNGQHFTFMDGDETDNTESYLLGYDERKINRSSMSFSDEERSGYIKLGRYSNIEIIIELDPLEKRKDLAHLSFYQRLAEVPVTGKIFIIDNDFKVALGTCILSLRKKHFRNLNYSR